jgi:5'-3' exonuclease
MRLLLVDGHYYLYRSFFAIRGLSNSRGEPTNAIYGFAKALRKMVADVKPDFGAVIWDCGLPEHRTILQPAYKQNRPEMPDEMRSQEKWLQKNVPLFGLASLCAPNTEADDLIACYALKAMEGEGDVVIATNDKDILTLAGPRISIYSTNKVDAGANGFALLGPSEVQTKWGVKPEQIAEVLALTGDSSDNIPGVGGIGEKTAARLINQYSTTENLLACLSSVMPEKLRAKLEAGREQIIANRQMVALHTGLPLPQPLTELKIAPQYPALIAALRDCEFKGLLKEVEDEAARTELRQGDLL